jgi:hypothetical protein
MRRLDEPFEEPGALAEMLAADVVPFCAEMGVSAASARQAIRARAARAGYEAHTLVEWSNADAPGEMPDGVPVLFYAALLPRAAADDMPLGLGETAAEALGDLLWALGSPVLLAALAADDPEPACDDTLAEELAHSGVW